MSEKTIVQKAGWAMLKSRTARLIRLLELEAPPVILCREAMLVFRAACQIDPAVAGEALASSLAMHYVHEKNICHWCQNVVCAPGATLCEKCRTELDAEAEEEVEAMRKAREEEGE